MIMNKKPKVLTYNLRTSNVIGGVEELIRQLHTLSLSKGFEVEEVCQYEVEGGAPKKHHKYNITILQKAFRTRTRFTKLLERLSIYKYFSLFKNSKGNILFVFVPGVLLFIPAKFIKNNHIVLVQTNSISKIFNTLAKLAMRIHKSRIDSICVYTNLDKQKLIEKYNDLNINNIYVIPRGCKIDPIESEKKINKKLVTIARISEEQKNFIGMIKAFSLLPHDYSLDIYGVGSDLEVERLLANISGHPRIRFCGIASDIKETLKEYGVFLLTSHYEGFGQTLIESRSQGVPIVAFNTFDALDWILKDNKCGKSVPYADYKAFSEAILEVTASENTYAGYSKHCIQYSSETDMKLVKEKWSRLLNRFCTDKL
ncbi:glycosyltransferase [Vibrio sp. Vb1554]|uniref:glycosyltransferase n=1 Tax=Vibrio sp. Vb1554 TaxID=3074642 RepID=UPI00296755E8|nr:glycosyltransferase [Vibrio sp. Vb1554]MDW3048534.1 glycosyltransferase [Vibrio sp. Vb1554]